MFPRLPPRFGPKICGDQGVSKGLLRAPPCEGQDLFMLLQEDPRGGKFVFVFFGCVGNHAVDGSEIRLTTYI